MEREKDLTIEIIGELFAEDIINYQKLGGNMNDLTAFNVYNVLKGEKALDDLSPIDIKMNALESLSVNEQLKLLDNYNLDIKNKLDSFTYSILFKILGTNKTTFNALTINQKHKFVKEGYKFYITTTNQKER